MKQLFLSLLPLVAAFALVGSVSGSVEAAGKPKVLFQTSMGDFTVELEPDLAPQTVENFLNYVREGHYNGTIFHRVIKGFMIQGGGFDKNFERQETGKPVENEADKGLENERGTIAMARTGDPHSATDQFFVNSVFNGFLNHRSKTQQGWGYTAFGKVIDGMNIVGRIGRVDTGPAGPFPSDVPLEPVIIKKATITSN